jgi:hypothetical protein
MMNMPLITVSVFIAAGALEIGEFEYTDFAMVGLMTLA